MPQEDTIVTQKDTPLYFPNGDASLILYNRHPIQYHNATAGENPWRKATAMYVLPAVLLSFVVNAPKFFELEMR